MEEEEAELEELKTELEMEKSRLADRQKARANGGKASAEDVTREERVWEQYDQDHVPGKGN